MAKHIHADLMLQYAQDAMTTDKPWELWEFKFNKTWEAVSSQPLWDETIEYRRKPRTININGFEVPEPVREMLSIDENYYVASTTDHNRFFKSNWQCDSVDIERLRRGLIHLTRQAAELHVKALLSFTEVQS